MQDIADNSDISKPRILTIRGSKVFFNESIASDLTTDEDDSRYTQYILVSNEPDHSIIRKLSLKAKAPDSTQDLDPIVVVKRDFLCKRRIIVFFGAALDDSDLSYATAEQVKCDERHLVLLSSSLRTQDIEKVINDKTFNFNCQNYDLFRIPKNEDNCSDNPKDPQNVKITHGGVEKEVLVYRSTSNTSICYKFELGNFKVVINF